MQGFVAYEVKIKSKNICNVQNKKKELLIK